MLVQEAVGDVMCISTVKAIKIDVKLMGTQTIFIIFSPDKKPASVGLFK